VLRAVALDHEFSPRDIHRRDPVGVRGRDVGVFEQEAPQLDQKAVERGPAAGLVRLLHVDQRRAVLDADADHRRHGQGGDLSGGGFGGREHGEGAGAAELGGSEGVGGGRAHGGGDGGGDTALVWFACSPCLARGF
jgi:hypothetical protein